MKKVEKKRPPERDRIPGDPGSPRETTEAQPHRSGAAGQPRQDLNPERPGEGMKPGTRSDIEEAGLGREIDE